MEKKNYHISMKAGINITINLPKGPTARQP